MWMRCWKQILLAGSAACLLAAIIPTVLQAAPPAGDASGTILIRPYNYDPANEWDYTLRGGETLPGHRADGHIWNAAPGQGSAPVSPVSVPSPPTAGGDGPALPPAEMTGAYQQYLPAPVPMSYSQVYATIPFSRTEYEANPSYRHDTTVEMLFGTLRPTTVVKQFEPHVQRYPEFYRYPFARYPDYHRVDVRQRVKNYTPYGYNGIYGY